MKKLIVFVSTVLLGATLSFAQGSPAPTPANATAAAAAVGKKHHHRRHHRRHRSNAVAGQH